MSTALRVPPAPADALFAGLPDSPAAGALLAEVLSDPGPVPAARARWHRHLVGAGLGSAVALVTLLIGSPAAALH